MLLTRQRKIELAFGVASKVYLKKLTNKEGKILLHSQGVNIISAQNLINNFRCLMEGRIFKRAMSELEIKYLLPKIREVHGNESYKNSLAAMDLWLDYYENTYKTKRRNLHIYLESLKSELSDEITLSDVNNQFELELSKSLSDSSESRNIRLSKATKMPTKIKVTAYIFRRNSDVVAEVLVRAKGVCEECHNSAPFIRAKDNSPYLEVHHIKQLADGGEDTVKNAVALCPNCHRKLHFG